MKNALQTIQPTEIQKVNNSAAVALINSFLSESTARETTIRSYRKSLNYFLTWAEENVVGRSIERADVVRYQKGLIDERHLSPNSVAAYMLAVRNFFAWLDANKVGVDVAKGIKAPKVEKEKIVHHLTTERSRQLLDYFRTKSLRDFAIVNLCLRTGLRSIEVVRANVGDISLIGDVRVLYIQGKGKSTKSDFVELEDKAFAPIREYLETRGNLRDEDALFASESNHNNGGRLTTRSVRRICKEGMKAVGIDERGYSAHVLRHTTAVTMLSKGATSDDIQFTLRHASPTTTKRYFESGIAEERLRRRPEALLNDAF